MLYLGIDQHARQLTVSLRDQQGDVLRPDRLSHSNPLASRGAILRGGGDVSGTS